MQSVFLVRHGETQTNQQGVFRGAASKDDPITEKGWGQARAAAEFIAPRRFNHRGFSFCCHSFGAVGTSRD